MFGNTCNIKPGVLWCDVMWCDDVTATDSFLNMRSEKDNNADWSLEPPADVKVAVGVIFLGSNGSPGVWS